MLERRHWRRINNNQGEFITEIVEIDRIALHKFWH